MRSRVRGMNIDVDGLDEFVDDIERFRKKLPKYVNTALRGEAGLAIRDAARARTPRRTGTLRNSIKVVATRGGPFGMTGAVIIGPMGPHRSKNKYGNEYAASSVGIWIESGTRKHPIGRDARGGQRRFERGQKTVLRLPNGVWTGYVDHPGFRGKRVMSRTMRLKSTRTQVEAALIREFEKNEKARS